MAAEAGDLPDSQACNLAEFCQDGLTRPKARTIRKHGFRALPHRQQRPEGRGDGAHGGTPVSFDDQLAGEPATNRQDLRAGCQPGVTRAPHCRKVCRQIPGHRIVPQRRAVAPGAAARGSERARRGVSGWTGASSRSRPRYGVQVDACFAMVCHHCGSFYVEFFLNARQENLLGRDAPRLSWPRAPRRGAHGQYGFKPYWARPRRQACSAATTLPSWGASVSTRPSPQAAPPFTKGRSSGLIRLVKGNFLAGRDFTDITTLNEEAPPWCAEQCASRWRRAVACAV